MRRALVAADLAAVLVAYGVAILVSGTPPTSHAGVWIAVTLPIWVLLAALHGLYGRDEQRADHSTLDELVPLLWFVTLTTWLGLAGAWVIGLDVSPSAVASFWATALVASAFARAIARVIVRRRPSYVQNAIIVGAGDVGQLVGRKLQHHSEFGIRLVGFVDDDPKRMRQDLDATPMLGSPSEIVELVREHNVQRVVVAFSNDRHDQLLALVRRLREMDVQIDLVPRLFEAVGPSVGLHAVEGLPLVALRTPRPTRFGIAMKRATDVVLASAMIVAISPLFVWITWRVRRDSPGPVLFRQRRLGARMQEFTLLKFRTMTVDTEAGPHRQYIQQIMDPTALPEVSNLYKLDRSDRVTKVGAWLRRTSLDELPQLFNVLRGEMSLVGPRPCIPYETEHFEPHHFDRFLVPAGMTGLWQVSARANSTFREALELDAAYARNRSFGLDIWLLARTPLVVLRGRKVTA